MTWTIPVEQSEDGELFITFPEDLMEETGWQEGDDLEWIDNLDGSWSLQRIKN